MVCSRPMACIRCSCRNTATNTWRNSTTGSNANVRARSANAAWIFSSTDSIHEAQQHFFDGQLELAREHALPLIVHARRSVDAVIASIKRIGGLRGVVHSFSGSAEQARQLAQLGFMIGLGGPVTYERANRLRKLAASVPIESLLLETDAPDQPDAGIRGQRNEPARHGPTCCRMIAELRGDSTRRDRRGNLGQCRSACSACPRRAQRFGLQQYLQRLADRGERKRAGDVGRRAQPGAAIELQRRIRAQLRTQAANAAVGLRIAHVLQRIHRRHAEVAVRLFGKLNSPRSFLRISDSIASCSVRERSRTRTWVASVRPPAEPTVMSGCLRRRHQAIASTLVRKLSQASMTRSWPVQHLLEVGRGQERVHGVDVDRRIDRAATLGHRLGLVAAVMALQCRQLAVGVGQAQVVGIDQPQMADARARQRFRCP